MELKSRQDDGILVLELEGRLDAHQAPAVSQWLTDNISPSAALLVINLQKVNFIDSIALAVLVKAIKRCKEKNGELHLCNVTKPVKIILELTLLNKVFNIFDDESSAVNAFKKVGSK